MLISPKTAVWRVAAWSVPEERAGERGTLRLGRPEAGRPPRLVKLASVIWMAMACVTPPKAYDFDPVHIFAHPRADVWLAVMDLGVQRNWTIKAVEPEAGHVVFEVVEVDRDAADCGRVPFGVTSGMPSVGISFTVRGDDSSAGVRVSIRVMRPYQVGEHEGMTRCESTGMMERMIGEWLQAILDGPLQGHHLAAVDGLLTVGLPYYTTRL